jgi:putative nucleotidyltransferase with HDIG domain
MVLDSAKARKKIESVSDLPTLPTVASHIIAMANSPKTNAADVGKMIEQDQALTAKVLKLVNSSFYGFPGQIKSIQHAVVILGFNKVKNVVMTASVFDLSKGRKSLQIDIPKLWEHCLGTAIGARVVASSLGGGLQPDDAFVGGLIHDIGKLILDQFLTEDYMVVTEKVSADNCLIRSAEKEVLGFTHNTVGTWVAEKWRLPPNLLHSIQYHHRPDQARENREMVAAVHLGDILARSLGIGAAGDNRMPEIKTSVWQLYNLTAKFLDESIATMLVELKKAKEFFDLIESQ